MNTTNAFPRLVCFFTICISVSAQNVVQDCSWVSGPGNYENGANWSCGVVPADNAGTNFNISIGDISPNVDGVRLSTLPSIFHLAILPGSVLYFTNNGGLSIQNFPDAVTGYPEQDIDIGGMLVFQNASNSIGSLRLARGNMTLRGIGGSGGTILLTNGGSSITGITGNANYDTRLIIQDGTTIRGAGEMNSFALVVNPQCQIFADSGTLHYAPNTSLFMSTNEGLLQSSVGGTLVLDGGGANVTTNIPTLYNSSGLVAAQGVTTLKNGFIIVGGMLQSYGGGRLNGGGALQDLTVGFASEFDVIANNAWYGSITNHGLFFVSGNNAIQIASPVVNLSGGGFVTLSTNGAGYLILLNHTFHNLDNLIDGAGEIESSGAFDILDNQGRIEADVPGQYLELLPPGGSIVWTNSGTLEATNGGTLLTSGVLTLDNTNGLIDAEAGSTNRLPSVKVFGGTVQAEGTNGVVRLETSELYNLTTTTSNGGLVQVVANGNQSKIGQILNVGDIEILNGATLGLAENVTNNGRIFMDTNVTQTTQLFLPGTQVTISGSGIIDLGTNGAGLFDHVINGNGASPGLVNMGNTIRGTGFIENIIFDNQGIVEANAATAILISESVFAPWTNRGTLHAEGAGGITILEPKFSNQGTVQIDPGSQFYVNSGDAYEQTSGLTTVNGLLLTQTASGTVSLAGGILAGSGTISDNVSNSSGVVSPGAPLGKLTISHSYIQQTNGALQIEIGGTVPGVSYDQLMIASSATLAGGLNVSFTNGFLPTTGSTFEILKCSSRAGTFTNIGFTAGNGVTLLTRYSATNVTLVAVATVLLVQPASDANGFHFSFQTVSGVSYQEQYTDSLAPPAPWQDFGPAISGDGTIAIVTNTPILPSQRFYRVRFQ